MFNQGKCCQPKIQECPITEPTVTNCVEENIYHEESQKRMISNISHDLRTPYI